MKKPSTVPFQTHFPNPGRNYEKEKSLILLRKGRFEDIDISEMSPLL